MEGRRWSTVDPILRPIHMAHLREWLEGIYTQWFKNLDAIISSPSIELNEKHMEAIIDSWRPLLEEYLHIRDPLMSDFQLVGYVVLSFVQCVNAEVEDCPNSYGWIRVCEGRSIRDYRRELLSFTKFYFTHSTRSALVY